MESHVQEEVVMYVDETEISNNETAIESGAKVIYLPYIGYCNNHPNMFTLEDEKLVKPGDKFNSHNDFVQYINENAKRWLFYYKCSDSRRPNTTCETYLYTCVYLRGKEKYVKKGMRKRKNNIKTNCPCKIKLRRLEREEQLTVVFVCNHHDHPLTEDEFFKLQHGRRLPPYIKEEIMDLITLQVDMEKIKKYVLLETGFNMKRTFFYQIERIMKKKNFDRQICEERMMEMLQKINDLESITRSITDNSHDDDEEQFIMERSAKRLRSSCNAQEEFVVSNSIKEDNDSQVVNTQQPLDSETQIDSWILEQCSPKRNVKNEATDYEEQIIIKPYESEHNEEIEETEHTIESLEHGISHEYVVCETISDPDDNRMNLVRLENGEAAKIIYTYSRSQYDAANTSEEGRTGILHDQTGEFTENVEVNDENEGEYEGDENVVFYEADDTVAGNDGVIQEDSVEQDKFQSTMDVYSPDGKMKGFVVKMKRRSDDTAVQTGRRKTSTTQVEPTQVVEIAEQNRSSNIESYVERVSNDTYKKHEYVHKYNITDYMRQRYFSRYIKTLSKEIQISETQIIKNVHNERAMLKMTTTHKGKEGNTRIWYMTVNFE